MKSTHSSLSAGALLLFPIVMAVLTTYFTPQPPNPAPASAPPRTRGDKNPCIMNLERQDQVYQQDRVRLLPSAFP
jgi:hypothetical protein